MRAIGAAEASRRSFEWQLIAVWFLAVAGFFMPLPFGEFAIDDDWSWARTTFRLLETGRLEYNGWGEVMVGAQACWGALFARLFGPSFFVLRLSTLFLSLGCAGLTYCLGRRWGLTPGYALFASAALVLSPVYIPMAASYMTDVPALFASLLLVYCFARAADPAIAGRNAALWLAAGAVAGVLGGTVRQIVWVLLLALLPMAGVLRIRILAAGHSASWWIRVAAGAWVLSAAVIGGCALWFYRQPYIAPRPFGLPPSIGYGGIYLVGSLAVGVYTLTLFVLPAVLLAAVHAPVLRRGRGALLALVAALLLFGAILLLASVDMLQHRLPDAWPYWGNAVYANGIFQGTFPGEWGWALPVAVRGILLLLVGLGAGILVALASRPVALALRRQATGLGPLQLLAAALTVVYSATLLLRASYEPGSLLDRYLLLLLPFALFALLRHCQEQRPSRALVSGAVALQAVFAAYGIAGTHDYFAASRARITLLEQASQQGVPRDRILVGLEPDAWEEMRLAGYVNDFHIRNPAGAYHPVQLPQDVRATYTLASRMPHLAPEYLFLLLTPELGRPPGAVGLIEFNTWLPPRNRVLYAVNVPALEAARAAAERGTHP